MIYTVSEAARELNTSTTTIYRWIKRSTELNRVEQLRKQGGKITLTADEVDFIRRSTAFNTVEQDVEQDAAPSGMVEVLQDRVEHLEKSLNSCHTLLNTVLQEQADKDRRHDTIIMSLTKQIQNQTAVIEDLRQAKTQPVSKPTPAKVTPIRQAEEKKEHPAKSWGPLKKAVVIMFAPHLLRGSGIRAA